MENTTLHEDVAVLWRKLRSEGYTVKDVVEAVFEAYPNVDHNELTHALYLVAGTRGAADMLKYIPRRKESETGCSNIVDPISQLEIEEGRSISYTENGVKYCFDIDTLYEYIMKSKNTGRPINPLNRQGLPDEFVRDVIARSTAPLTSTFEGRVLTYPTFTRYGELILTVHRLTGDILESLVTNDVLADGLSVYLSPLLQRVRSGIGQLTLEPYPSTKERDIKLLSMFRFAKETSDELSQSVKLFVGALLGLVPVYSDRDVNIPVTYTVMDAIVAGLRTYGYDKWDVVDFRLVHGTSLYTLVLSKLVTEAIPGETIYAVPFEFGRVERARVRRALLAFAERENDHPLKQAMMADLDRLLDRMIDGDVQDNKYLLLDNSDILLDRVVSALVSGKVRRTTSTELWEVLSELDARYVRRALIKLPLKDVSLDTDWPNYMRARVGAFAKLDNAIKYAKLYITRGKFEAPIDLSTVVLIDAPELVEYLLLEGALTKADISKIVLLSMNTKLGTSLLITEYATPPTIHSTVYPSVNVLTVNGDDELEDIVLRILGTIGYEHTREVAMMVRNPLTGEMNYFSSYHYSMKRLANHVIEVGRVSDWEWEEEDVQDWMKFLFRAALERDVTPLLSLLGLRSVQSILEQSPLILTYTECNTVIQSLSFFAQGRFVTDVTKALLLHAHPNSVSLLQVLWESHIDLRRGIRRSVRSVPLSRIVGNLDWKWYMKVMFDAPGRNLDKSIRLILWYRSSTRSVPRGVSVNDVADTMSEDLAQALLDGGYVSQDVYTDSVGLIRERVSESLYS